MNEADLIDQFMDALVRDPKTEPPVELDAQIAEFVRALVASEGAEMPIKRLQGRIWQKALAQAVPESLPSTSKSTFERVTILNPETPIDMGDEQMHITTQTVLQPLPRSERRFGQQILTLGAAVLLLVLLGGLVLTMFNNQIPDSLTAGGLDTQTDPLEANKALLRRYYEEIWGKQNFAVFPELFAPSYTVHFNEQTTDDTEAFEWFVPQLHTAMPDLTVDLKEVAAEGNAVAGRVILTGKHTGNYANLPPTNRMLTVSLTTLVHIADGKITEEWITLDYLGFLAQAGAIPNMVFDSILGSPRYPTTSALLRNTSGKVVDYAYLVEMGFDSVEMRVEVQGLTPGLHGIHIYEVGVCDAGGDTPFSSAGGHFDVLNREHGLENPSGDLPNLEAGEDGAAHYRTSSDRITLSPSRNSVLDEDGSAIIITIAPDDQKTDPDGSSGDQAVCGVIEQ